MQFNKEIEVRTLFKGNQQSKSKQQPGKSTTTSREELQSTAQRCDKKLQELVKEVNTKTGIGYKINEESDRPNKLKVLYQQPTDCSPSGGRNTQATAALKQACALSS